MYLYFSFKIIISRKITYFILFVWKLLLTPEKNGKNIFLVIISWKKNILLNPYLLQQTIASAYNSQQKSYPLCKCSFIYTFDNCAGFYVKSLKITISTYRYSRALKWCLTEWFNRKSFGNFNALRISSHSIQYWAISCGCYSNLKY